VLILSFQLIFRTFIDMYVYVPSKDFISWVVRAQVEYGIA